MASGDGTEDPALDLEVLGLDRHMSWGDALARTLDQVLRLAFTEPIPWAARATVGAAQRILDAWRLDTTGEQVAVVAPAGHRHPRIYDQTPDPEPTVGFTPVVLRGGRTL